ncbi:MAG: SDR family NAD(P)-dependent oxidoreductase [Paracoccaceae bacterium]
MSRRALVLGASGGIGSAVAARLALEDWRVTALSRKDGLDWRDPARAESVIGNAIGPFDLVFDATGALEIDGAGPEKQLATIEADAMAAQFAVNAIGPALLLKHYKSLLPRKGHAVFATLSARVGSIGDHGLGGWISYRASKAALNQIVKTAAVELARTRPEAVVVALHPGTVATTFGSQYRGAREALSPAQSAAQMLAVLKDLTPAETSGFFAYDGSRVPW